LRKIANIQAFSDQELINCYKLSGNNEYVGELYERYTRFVFLVSMKYLKNVELSKDSVMQIFEKLFDDLKKHEIQNFKSWLHTVTKNHCLLYLRGLDYKSKKENEIKKEMPKVMESDPILHLDIEAEQENKLKQLKQAIEELHEEQKICVDLFFLQEKSYQEIEVITGFTPNQVKSYIQNGKRNLKNSLSKFQNNITLIILALFISVIIIFSL